MDPIPAAITSLLNALQSVGQELPAAAPTPAALLALVGKDVGMIYLGQIAGGKGTYLLGVKAVIAETFELLRNLGHTESEARRLMDAALAEKKKYADVQALVQAIYQQSHGKRPAEAAKKEPLTKGIGQHEQEYHRWPPFRTGRRGTADGAV